MKKLIFGFLLIAVFAVNAAAQSEASVEEQHTCYDSASLPFVFHHKYYGIGKTVHFTVMNRPIYLVESPEYERLVDTINILNEQNEKLKLQILQMQKAKID